MRCACSVPSSIVVALIVTASAYASSSQGPEVARPLYSSMYSTYRALTRSQFETLQDTGKGTDRVSQLSKKAVETPSLGGSNAEPECAGWHRPPIVIVPGFEGSLLATPESKLFLSPLSKSSWTNLADILRLTYLEEYGSYESAAGTSRHLQVTLAGGPYDLAITDYPAATCAPGPLSRLAHCLPLPASGPISILGTHLSKIYGYQPGRDIFGAPYDWRLPPSHLTGGRWGKDLVRLVSSLNDTLVVAHGYGCIIASRIISMQPESWRREHISRLYCLAGTLDGTVSSMLRLISGQLSPAETARMWSSASDVNFGSRLDFREVEFELGLRRSHRRSLPVVAGLWDTSRSEEAKGCVALYRSFGSLIAMVPRYTSNTSSASFVRFGGRVFEGTQEGTHLMVMTCLSDSRFADHFSGLWTREAEAEGARRAPGVPVTCVFGTGLDTPGKLIYSDVGETGRPELMDVEMRDGDGLVESRSALVCQHWKAGQSDHVQIVEVPNAGHFDLAGLSRSLFSDLNIWNATCGSSAA
jgi:pimeloyl-ACP methyl ester carboxylesterase